jgi:hypothetical protein
MPAMELAVAVVLVLPVAVDKLPIKLSVTVFTPLVTIIPLVIELAEVPVYALVKFTMRLLEKVFVEKEDELIPCRIPAVVPEEFAVIILEGTVLDPTKLLVTV